MNHTERRRPLGRRGFLGGLLAGGAALLSGCQWDGHFTLFGYTTKPPYDETIKTIYVPIFVNQAFQTTPYRGMEYELTRMVMEEIKTRTPFRITSDPNRADTELLGTIRILSKNIPNRNQQNQVREGELTVVVDLVWRDLRTGKILSNPPQGEGILRPQEVPPFDPDNPPPPAQEEKPIPTTTQAVGRFLPEVGESSATAQTRVCKQLAVQIVGMLEKPWKIQDKPSWLPP